ncbi:MAG: M15 family metallopeptidase [Oscillospiraceae bacterium]|nr:M15 family metallopeptidase [Oscillospiraceae bacterium]
MIRRKRRQKELRRRRAVLGALVLCLALIPVLLFSCCDFQKAEAQAPAGAGQPSAQPRQKTASPEPVKAETVASKDLPEGWKILSVSEEDLAEGSLVLVNRDYGYDPGLPQTVSVYDCKNHSYLVKDTYLSIREEAVEALNDWMDAFAAETGRTDVNIVAGWRSFEDQTQLYQNAVETKGQAHADAYLALPGHSEHHTGLAIDLDTYDVDTGASGGFDGDGDYAWAVDHAWEFGYIQRYPSGKSHITGIDFESWHFRYVGLPHAFLMRSEDLCMEEYIDYLRAHPFAGEHLQVSCFGTDYELYFCPKNQVIVPTAGNYTISGNNVDGFIITIQRP